VAAGALSALASVDGINDMLGMLPSGVS